MFTTAFGLSQPFSLVLFVLELLHPWSEVSPRLSWLHLIFFSPCCSWSLHRNSASWARRCSSSLRACSTAKRSSQQQPLLQPDISPQQDGLLQVLQDELRQHGVVLQLASVLRVEAGELPRPVVLLQAAAAPRLDGLPLVPVAVLRVEAG